MGLKEVHVGITGSEMACDVGLKSAVSAKTHVAYRLQRVGAKMIYPTNGIF